MNFIDHNKVSAKIGKRLTKNKLSSQLFFYQQSLDYSY